MWNRKMDQWKVQKQRHAYIGTCDVGNIAVTYQWEEDGLFPKSSQKVSK